MDVWAVPGWLLAGGGEIGPVVMVLRPPPSFWGITSLVVLLAAVMWSVRTETVLFVKLIYMFICIHIDILHIYKYLYTYSICTYIHKICTHKYEHIHKYKHLYTIHIYTYVHMYLYTYIHVYIYISIYPYIHICVYIHISVNMWWSWCKYVRLWTRC